ncbi:hypothetical protein JAAARDRAFT_30427 [Jaapia argillacea MUCL 33604]|uniref:MPN domain-containing protein n=1 Tax=Jaapia argillacea MUCL 33604 TaxID=933084 RepID=A0A067Q8P0_9AGAM|nr:hypothetical protein JAAARDRAFT_30427 [Jaapia argillacea MUCL 33604]
MASYTVSHQAYLKVILHSTKYPHKAVNGVLLGSLSGSRHVEIKDAVPLLHHWTSLSPMMEIGFDLARSYAQSQGLQVVGYYQACERLDDTALAPVGETLAGKIKEHFQDAVAFVVDGEVMKAGAPALVPFLPSSSSSWRPVSVSPAPFTEGSSFVLESSGTPARALYVVQRWQMHHKFGDFDDHLEDVTIDWLRNPDCHDEIP